MKNLSGQRMVLTPDLQAEGLTNAGHIHANSDVIKAPTGKPHSGKQ